MRARINERVIDNLVVDVDGDLRAHIIELEARQVLHVNNRDAVAIGLRDVDVGQVRADGGHLQRDVVRGHRRVDRDVEVLDAGDRSAAQHDGCAGGQAERQGVAASAAGDAVARVVGELVADDGLRGRARQNDVVHTHGEDVSHVRHRQRNHGRAGAAMAVVDGEGELVSADIADVGRVDVVAVGVVDRHRTIAGLGADGVAQAVAIDVGTGDGAGDDGALVARGAAGDGHWRIVNGLNRDGGGGHRAGASRVGDPVGESVNTVEVERGHIHKLAAAERNTAMAWLAVDRVSGGVASVDVARRWCDIDADSIFSAGGEDVGSHWRVIGSGNGDRHRPRCAGGQAIAGGEGEAVRAVEVGSRGVDVSAVGAEHHRAAGRAGGHGKGQGRAFGVGAGDGAANRGVFNTIGR